MTTPTQSVTGALTFETVPALYQSFSGCFEGAGDLTIDLSQVTHTDSAGLALLIEWMRHAQAANRTLRYANIPEQVQTLIRINGLQDALTSSSS